MKKVKKIFKVVFLILIIFTSIAIIGMITFYKVTTRGVSLETEKFKIINPTQNLIIYDNNNNEIKPNSVSYIKLSKLSSQTKNAFICAEDKRFYKHKGMDYLRIGGAVLSNIKSGSFSQGASTISQQLVKNSQLTNEKTINRKLKEIKLTKELENKYSKDEILELYLNKIYFGNGCYGIENAAKHYFGKSATALSLDESALLAASINAPSVYDIENNQEKALKRRNLILELMQKYGKITTEELDEAKAKEIQLNLSSISGNSFLYKNILSEACNILNENEYNLTNKNYKIYTSIDTNLCKETKSFAENQKINADIASIVIDNKTHKILAISGKSNLLNNSWQPGSLIKPILVYTPAIEKDMISPATKILDNKINIAGYSPENSDKKYHGYVSVKEAVSKSYNIPAVKILNELGVNEAISYAEKFGIEFEKNDNHLALALGAFEKGVKPKTICDAYSCFANNGKFQSSSYISKITKDGKVIYNSTNSEEQIIKDSTAYLINDMLIECAKNGTAKRLKSLSFPVCSKTGTVGKANSTKNKLAWNIAYTKNHMVLTLIQGDELPPKINGATTPCLINKTILSSIYKQNLPDDFEIPKSVTKINLDKTKYQENELLETKNSDGIEEYFSLSNTPKKESDFTLLKAINSKNHKPILCFTINKNYDYYLIRSQEKREEIIFSSLGNNENFITFCDKTAKNGQIYTYKLKICGKLKNEQFFSNDISLKVY